MKKLVWGILALLLMSCAQMDAKQTLATSIVFSQATARYIEAGDILERKAAVTAVVDKVLVFVKGNPEAPMHTLLDVVNTQIDWTKMTVSDQLLIQAIVQAGVDSISVEGARDRIDPNRRVNLLQILNVIRNTAQLVNPR